MTSAHMPKFRAALVQLRSGREVAANVDAAIDLVRQAKAAGANYVQTPEVTTLMELDRARLMRELQPEEGNAALAAFQNTARDLGLWLHIGSMGVKLAEGRIANRSYLLAPDGRISARYDKIHMFDVDLGEGEAYRESDSFAPGDKAIVAALPWGGLGLTICYDVRFPALHRALAQGGATFIASPAAFTRITGEAHWHLLLRARAIETQCFVFAANQGGLHDNGRETYGHSLIISPWGEILAEAGEDPCFISAEIDLQTLEDARRRVPSLTHDRVFDVVRMDGAPRGGRP